MLLVDCPLLGHVRAEKVRTTLHEEVTAYATGPCHSLTDERFDIIPPSQKMNH